MAKFKVNDKVKIVSKINKHKFEMFEEVTVIDVCEAEGYLRYSVKNDKEYWYVEEKEIKRV